LAQTCSGYGIRKSVAGPGVEPGWMAYETIEWPLL